MSNIALRKRGDPNRMRPDDHPVHDWYRFVLSFPPHLVREYLDRLGVRTGDTVLDPFCGTGTTLVECKKMGIDSVGLERNPMAHFASSVKVDWSVDPARLAEYSEEVARTARSTLIDQGVDDWGDLPLLARNGPLSSELRTLDPSRSKLLLKNSISPIPLQDGREFCKMLLLLLLHYLLCVSFPYQFVFPERDVDRRSRTVSE